MLWGMEHFRARLSCQRLMSVLAFRKGDDRGSVMDKDGFSGGEKVRLFKDEVEGCQRRLRGGF